MRQAFLEIRGMSYVFCWCKAVFLNLGSEQTSTGCHLGTAMKMDDLEIEFVD